VYEVRWLEMVGHSGGVSKVLWRRTFCLRACFDRNIGKNCTTSYHQKVRKDVERFEVCIRERPNVVNMDEEVYHNEACERKSCLCCFSLIVHRRCRTTTTKEIIEASPFCDPRTWHCS
jgi:hypothetical protein